MKYRWIRPRLSYSRNYTPDVKVWRSTGGDFVGFMAFRVALQLRDSR